MADVQARIDEDAREEAVFNAISDVSTDDLMRFGGWDELDILSSATFFEGLEAVPGGIAFGVGGTFEAAATVYVTLNYGSARDSSSMSDSYPAVIRGIVDSQLEVTIGSIEIDTESFYQD